MIMKTRCPNSLGGSPLGAGALLLVVVAGTAVVAAAQTPQAWEIDTANSRVVVHVDAAGLLSPFLQDHTFTPQEWSGHVRFDPDRPEGTKVEVEFMADSLHNLQDALSPDDRETVDRQVRGPDVLHVEEYPRIRFVAETMEIDERTAEEDTQIVRGSLRGRLTVRDHTRPIEVPISARWSSTWLRATGTASFRQSDFGIEPYSRALGTIAVADRLAVEIDLQASAAPR
jgi:polyisoprenoid-binding protein YceI